VLRTRSGATEGSAAVQHSSDLHEERQEVTAQGDGHCLVPRENDSKSAVLGEFIGLQGADTNGSSLPSSGRVQTCGGDIGNDENDGATAIHAHTTAAASNDEDERIAALGKRPYWMAACRLISSPFLRLHQGACFDCAAVKWG
jgi:hypothetical protein